MIEYTAETPFPTRDRYDLIYRYNTHRQWMIDDDGMTNNTMHKAFTYKMMWIYRKVMLINFLKSHPGRNGVPLNYVLRDNANPIARNNPNFLDDYADKTLLRGKLFTHDAAKAHSYIIPLISYNNISGQKYLSHKYN